MTGDGTMEQHKTRRAFLQWTAAGTATLMFSGFPAGAAPEKKLNFVFFLIDDMGWTDVGCFGSTYHKTPNIDCLASEGMKFTDAYAACPVCSPTRASILTGKYPARLNLTEWIPGLPPQPSEKIMSTEYLRELPLEELTIAEALKQAGYISASIGKWHLGKEAFYPEHQGFDLNIGGTESGMPADYFYPAWAGNPPIKGMEDEYLTDRLTLEAEKFIDQNRDNPFFMYLSHYAVHTPIQAKRDKIEKYRRTLDPNARHTNPVYAGMVESVDDCIGRIMKKLEDCGIKERTIVFFMSDNGGLVTCEGVNTPATSNIPLRAGKGHVYDGGIREPMIIAWPGVTDPGSVCTQPVISVDFYPTILEMAGVSNNPNHTIDGESLVPLLNKTGSLKREAIYWHYPHYSPQWATPAGAVRKGDYKLIEFFEDNHLELYNIVGDIGEKNDLLKFPYTHIENPYAAKAEELHALLKGWRRKVGARMPKPNPDYRDVQ